MILSIVREKKSPEINRGYQIISPYFTKSECLPLSFRCLAVMNTITISAPAMMTMPAIIFILPSFVRQGVSRGRLFIVVSYHLGIKIPEFSGKVKTSLLNFQFLDKITS